MANKVNNAPIHASTQDHLEIGDIKDDIVLLKNGGACVVIRTTAVNFGLLSETEQDSLIYSYAGFLNSLSFPIQIIIRSKKMDITSYLDLLKQHEQGQINEALKVQIQKYREFIASIIQENKVLDKGFYIVVPFSSLELGAKSGTKSLLKSRSSKPTSYSYDYILQKAKVALTPKRDNIIRLLSRMGLKAQALNTTELIKLFYEIYNPEEDIGQHVVSTRDYESPLVQPVVDMPIRNLNTVNLPKAPAIQPVRPPINRTQPRTAPSMRQPQASIRRPVPMPQARPTLQTPVATPPVARAVNNTQPVTVDQVQAVLGRLQSEVTKMNERKN